MRLRVLSDLHLECGLPDLPDLEADVIILAGDTAEGTRGVQWAIKHFPNTPVIYLAGNHEFYGHRYPSLLDELRSVAAGSMVHVLEQEAIVIGSVEFLGSTLWTDQNLWKSADTCAAYIEQSLNDYHRVRSDSTGTILRAVETRDAHSRARDWLTECCETAPARPRVIVTHHAPSPLSIPLAEWQASERDGLDSAAELRLLMRAAYASRLDQLVNSSGAQLWVHGHIHAPVDYHIGGTRVMANPKGYGRQLANRFQPGLVVQVGQDAGISV